MYVHEYVCVCVSDRPTHHRKLRPDSLFASVWLAHAVFCANQRLDHNTGITDKGCQDIAGALEQNEGLIRLE